MSPAGAGTVSGESGGNGGNASETAGVNLPWIAHKPIKIVAEVPAGLSCLNIGSVYETRKKRERFNDGFSPRSIEWVGCCRLRHGLRSGHPNVDLGGSRC